MTRIAWLHQALVVDDEHGLARSIATHLRDLGADSVHVAGTIAEANQAIQQSLSLVLCDVLLPDGNCRPVLEAVRLRAPRARFVMMTGHAGRTICTDLAFCGAHGFLEKPFDPQALEEELRGINVETLAERRIEDLVLESGLRRTYRVVRSRARERILRWSNDNISQAARILGVSRRAIYDLVGQRGESAASENDDECA
jgi:two-component system chemotaxis response regulator CheY